MDVEIHLLDEVWVSYSPDPVSADVSYDAFISTGSCGAGHKAEIMTWLAAYDPTPITKTDASPKRNSRLELVRRHEQTDQRTSL
ncbi:hypothetical protein HO133_008932 [Letharia lupina]|uniref:Uncharacterized protein n=1 Tax=Letharia lupina TaxID=560253 RepID=A0A8H6FFL6_9LECA|nr:uncharacterized protein HO133_008932 [Letharia lupina]KAF6226068.1 hypothetical protein HO133_008932 [Letharia lupina]